MLGTGWGKCCRYETKQHSINQLIIAIIIVIIIPSAAACELGFRSHGGVGGTVTCGLESRNDSDFPRQAMVGKSKCVCETDCAGLSLLFFLNVVPAPSFPLQFWCPRCSVYTRAAPQWSILGSSVVLKKWLELPSMVPSSWTKPYAYFLNSSGY